VPLPDDGKARGSAMGMAFRTSTEMIAGLVVGGLVGWQLDKWLGTSPVLLLLFFLLGAAAGIWNVIRAAWEMQSKASKAGTEMDQPGSDRDK
jgi:ATP synthase protein I